MTNVPDQRTTLLGGLPAVSQFALLADPLRLEIIESLARTQLCTCHLSAITGAQQAAISHHLRLLREVGAVLSEAEGRFTWYRLAPGVFTEALLRLGSITARRAISDSVRPDCAP